MHIHYGLSGACYEKGYQVLRDKGVAILGMSPGNSYYTTSTVHSLIDFTAGIFSKVYVVIPSEPSVHTWKALGYTDRESHKKADAEGSRLKNKVQKGIAQIPGASEFSIPFHIFTWSMEIEASLYYQQQMHYIYDMYKTNQLFSSAIHAEVVRVIEGRGHTATQQYLEKGAHYLLKEFAFIMASPDIVGTENVTIVYHKEWPLFNNLIDGQYGEVKRVIGFIVIS